MQLEKEEVDFSSFLLTIGNRTAEMHTDKGEDMIQIPQEYLVNSIDELIEKVFPHIEEGYLDKYFVSKFPGIENTYLSADTIAEDDLCNAYPTEFLNSIALSGMLPHSMTLGAPVILLRNLRAGPGNGL